MDQRTFVKQAPKRQNTYTGITDILHDIEGCVTAYLEKYFRKATKLTIGQLKDIAPTTISIKAKYKHGNYKEAAKTYEDADQILRKLGNQSDLAMDKANNFKHWDTSLDARNRVRIEHTW